MNKIEYRDTMLKIWETAQNLSDHVDVFSIADYHELENQIDRLVVDLITDCQESGVLTAAEARSEIEFCAKCSRAVHFASLTRIAWEYHYSQVFHVKHCE